MALISLALLTSCDDGASDSNNAADQVTAAEIGAANASDANQIQPETIVEFPKSGIACLNKDSLQAAVQYGLEGKATKMNSMFVKNGGDCIMLTPGKQYRVIDAEYNDPDIPEAGILEIVGRDITSAEHGAFTLVMSPDLVTVVKRPAQ